MSEPVKNTILEASLHLFKRFGYKKTTIEDIAHEAGIGKGSVYLHFKSKEDILLTLIRDQHQAVIEEWIKTVYKDQPAEKKIASMLKFHIREIQMKREEMSLETFPPHLVQSVLKMSGETKAQRLALLATVLAPLFPDETQRSERDKVAKIILDLLGNILFRLHMDSQFAWEEFLDNLLDRLLPKTA